MPKARELPSQRELNELLAYDPLTGVLSWKFRAAASAQWNAKHAGKPAGGISKSNGRIVVMIRPRLFLAHRLIWKMVTGEDPPLDLDHHDTDPANNRWTNLRSASKHQNLRNSRLHTGKTLPKGVSRKRDRFRASIYVNGRCTSLGVYDDPDSAHAAYCLAAAAAFGEFARFG